MDAEGERANEASGSAETLALRISAALSLALARKTR